MMPNDVEERQGLLSLDFSQQQCLGGGVPQRQAKLFLSASAGWDENFQPLDSFLICYLSCCTKFSL